MVNRGADICKAESIGVLLAVGDGSTIDCTIAAAAYYDGNGWDLVRQKAPVESPAHTDRPHALRHGFGDGLRQCHQ